MGKRTKLNQTEMCAKACKPAGVATDIKTWRLHLIIHLSLGIDQPTRNSQLTPVTFIQKKNKQTNVQKQKLNINLILTNEYKYK